MKIRLEYETDFFLWYDSLMKSTLVKRPYHEASCYPSASLVFAGCFRIQRSTDQGVSTRQRILNVVSSPSDTVSRKKMEFINSTCLFQCQSGNDPKKLDYDGYAASVFANFPISRSFDFYGLIFGNQLSGDFIGPGANNSTEYPIIAEDVEARTTQLSFGISYDPLAGTSYALPIFFGPGIVFTDLKETVLTNDPLGRDDFDLKMSAQSLMLYGGFQGAVRIKKHFMVGVFAVASQHLDDNDKCQSYSVDVREYGFFFDLSDPACQDGQNSSTSKIEYDLSLFSYGLTLGIPTWGVSLVAFSEVSETEYFEGVQLDMYQITFTL